jgi:hypothetical protein
MPKKSNFFVHVNKQYIFPFLFIGAKKEESINTKILIPSICICDVQPLFLRDLPEELQIILNRRNNPVVTIRDTTTIHI